MSEILIDYFNGFKNYFKTFSKAKAYKICKILVWIFVFLIFNIIALTVYGIYKYGKYKAYKEMKMDIKKGKDKYLSGIHTKPKQESISISEVKITDKKIKL